MFTLLDTVFSTCTIGPSTYTKSFDVLRVTYVWDSANGERSAVSINQHLCRLLGILGENKWYLNKNPAWYSELHKSSSKTSRTSVHLNRLPYGCQVHKPDTALYKFEISCRVTFSTERRIIILGVASFSYQTRRIFVSLTVTLLNFQKKKKKFYWWQGGWTLTYFVAVSITNTGCGRNNSHILKVNKNQTKQGTQKILLYMKSTYDAIFFKHF